MGVSKSVGAFRDKTTEEEKYYGKAKIFFAYVCLQVYVDFS